MKLNKTKDLEKLSKDLGHTFTDNDLLLGALTHPSVSGMGKLKNKAGETVNPYERLEFLGDRVLALIVAEWLLERYPEEKEGDIAKRHAALVRRESLDEIAEKISLSKYLALAEKGDGRINKAVLSDACEALIGALYLDGGLDVVRRFIRRVWEPLMEKAVKPPMDPKTQLQEWLLAQGLPLPVYELVHQSGPSHAPVFEVRVRAASGHEVIAQGHSKREAEKAGAKNLLAQIENKKNARKNRSN